MTNDQKLKAAGRRYRATYDRLYVASMRAGSEEESNAIDAKLRDANAEYDDAKERYS